MKWAILRKNPAISNYSALPITGALGMNIDFDIQPQ